MNAGQWARAYRAMAAELERIDAEERAEKRQWQSQTGSPLGNRRHVAAVRRRVGSGIEGASIIGRRYLLSPGALDEELEAVATRAKTTPANENETTKQRIERRLGIVRSA